MTFDPTALTGKRLWLRAKDLGADGSSVPTWADQSGNGNDAAAVITPATVSGSSTPAGGKAALFPGTSGTTYYNLPSLGMSTAGEIWVVVKADAATNNGGIGHFGSQTESTHYTYSGTAYDNFGRAATRQSWVPTLAVTSWRLLRIKSDGTGWQAWIDNASQKTATASVGWTTTPVLGAGTTTGASTSRFGGLIAEVLIRDTVSTSGEVADLIAYFNAEHGLTVPGGTVPGGTPQGAASGTLAWAGAAAGKRVARGVAAGALALSGAATGTAGHAASATGNVAWAGIAVGVSPADGAKEGSASGSVLWAGAAEGAAFHEGASTGALSWAGVAVGSSSGATQGAATGGLSWAGVAAGDNGQTEAAPWDVDASGLAIVGIVPPVGVFHVAYPAAAIPAAIDDVPLTRVSHQIPAGLITVNANGEPVPIDEADYPIVRESIGRLHVWAGGQDVTYLQDKVTRITSYSAALPFGERDAQVDFPQIMLLDAPPAALAGDKPVDIAIVKDDGSRINLWSGKIVSRAGGNAEQDVRSNRQCEGPLMSADHQIHQVPLILAPTDRGTLVAAELNGTGSRTFGTIAPAVTGMTTTERGSSSDRRLDYAQSQLAQMWTSDADQWTIARTSVPRAYKMVRKSTIGSTWTLTYGAPGVKVDLTHDETQRYNVIWGHGKAQDKDGNHYGWQNMFFPGLLPYDPPDYPFADTSIELELGTTDAMTDSGDGVTVWQTRMVELGFPLSIDGVIHQADKDAAARLQRLRGLVDNGEIGPQTWNGTWDVGTTGAALERIRLPLAYDPRVWPTLHGPNGKVIGPNPVYDRTIERYESDDLEYPPGTTKAQAIASAQEDLARNLDPGFTGAIELLSCPWEGWRGLIREGDRVNLLGYEGQTVALHVSHVEAYPGDGFRVSLRVDTKARDAMTLASVEARDRDSAADLARKPGPVNRLSQIDRNQTTPFEGESPAGKIPKLPINGDAGLWSVWPVFVSEVGTLAFIDIRTMAPACEFSFGLSGWPITPNQCAQYVGNPLTDPDAWTRNVDLLRSRFGLINSWGNSSEAAGAPGPGMTLGREYDDSPLSFQSQKAGWLYLWVFASQSCSIDPRSRIYPQSFT